jgi:hypothetical protein
MDVADDADGRVAIFSVDGTPEAAAPGVAMAARHSAVRARAARVGAWLDGAYAGAVVAAALVVILVLGLLLSRH